MELTSRIARREDVPELLPLIDAAIGELQKGYLDDEQIRSSRAIMGVDNQLIDDGTYFVVSAGDIVVGCGGWSRRATLYGGDHSAGRDSALLDPATDPAKVRAMYTHPGYTRRGVGRLILERCEAAAAAEGFTTLELMATLSGRPLYEACGFTAVEHLQDATGGTAVPLVRMRKAIVASPAGDRRRALLASTAERIADYGERVGELPVFPDVDAATVAAQLGELADAPMPAAAVVAQLAAAVEPALVSSTGPRYFGFVVGGSLDSALAADMLAVGWDQCAFNAFTSPAAAIVEAVAGRWLKELLGLPDSASFGFTTGGQGANTVALAAARHHVLAEAGWNVERDGLIGAPRLRVVAGAERHATIDRALRLLGLGAACVELVETGPQGAIDTDDLARVLDVGSPAPTIVCVQAGNVNTGAFDDLATATSLARRHGAWVHVDGAFGLWAAASSSLRHLVDGVEHADSWAVDGHKWLNVPYDSGYTFCAHPGAHKSAMSYTAAYLTGQGDDGLRGPGDFVLESSRRARGFATWAALRELGRDGVEQLVDRCCRLARLFAEQLAAVPGVTVMNDVVLNQVLVRFGDDATTDRVVAAVQRSGECWMGATTWHDMRLMRIAVSNWRTTEADVERSVAAIARAVTA